VEEKEAITPRGTRNSAFVIKGRTATFLTDHAPLDERKDDAHNLETNARRGEKVNVKRLSLVRRKEKLNDRLKIQVCQIVISRGGAEAVCILLRAT